MLSHHRKTGIGVIVLSVSLLLAFSLADHASNQRQPAASAAAPDWLVMTLTYRDESKLQGLQGGITTKVWRLSYQDAWHWRKELLQDSANSANVGTAMSMQGTTYTVYSAVTKDTFTKEYPAGGGPVVPEQWLAPGRESVLPAKGYGKSTTPDARQTRYTKTEAVPCQPDPDRRLTGVVQPAACATTSQYETTETIVYERGHGLPVEITDQVGPEITRHVVVTDVAFP